MLLLFLFQDHFTANFALCRVAVALHRMSGSLVDWHFFLAIRTRDYLSFLGLVTAGL